MTVTHTVTHRTVNHAGAQRKRCTCGGKVESHGTGANWGDLCCIRCGQAYCQDCGAALRMDTLTCPGLEQRRKPLGHLTQQLGVYRGR